MIILGINAYHGDASAAILVDGKIVAAAEEERFNRVKHCAGFPKLAIEYCLREAGARLRDVDHVAHGRDPTSNLWQKARGTFFSPLVFCRSTWDRIRAIAASGSFGEDLRRHFPDEASHLKAVFHNVEHHVAHAAGSYFASPFEEAALVSVDGFGDFVSLLTGRAEGRRMEIGDRVFFAHSLGTYYTMVSQYLGFPQYGDEGKVMAFAGLGDPEACLEKMRKVAFPDERNYFRLGLEYYRHHREGTAMTWREGTPEIERIWSDAMARDFGPARERGEPYEQRHYDVAAALQKNLEDVLLGVLDRVQKETGSERLALGGGVALNSVANGMIRERTGFRDIFILPAAGDGGLSVGGVYYVWHCVLGREERHACPSAYLGPGYSEEECRRALEEAGLAYERVERPEAAAVEMLVQGKIVGWFQGRMEFGPRALGNRSILVDPRRQEMKDTLNARIKHREAFRPFAPSILLEKTGEYFEQDYPSPHMLMVYRVRPEKTVEIPGVMHVDGTGRLQTVAREENALYYDLIAEFGRRTRVPIVLNTSFNDCEPIVCSPRDAVACFQKTRMDALFLGKLMARRGG
jgi:carbamoyltransferase